MVHSVEVNITSHPLSREESGVDFIVDGNDGKFGELRVSKGGVRWKPKNARDHHFVNWKELDELMRDRPRR
jgi:hypothetical protein